MMRDLKLMMHVVAILVTFVAATAGAREKRNPNECRERAALRHFTAKATNVLCAGAETSYGPIDCAYVATAQGMTAQEVMRLCAGQLSGLVPLLCFDQHSRNGDRREAIEACR